VVVGVNGVGKTTTVGKIARLLVAQGHSVLLGAADTFRAAAADQLETWGSRVGVPVVRALNQVNTGLGFESGLVIVVVAIMLDRMLRVIRK
jgi:signal recognition particle GTPase